MKQCRWVLGLVLLVNSCNYHHIVAIGLASLSSTHLRNENWIQIQHTGFFCLNQETFSLLSEKGKISSRLFLWGFYPQKNSNKRKEWIWKKEKMNEKCLMIPQHKKIWALWCQIKYIKNIKSSSSAKYQNIFLPKFF